MAGSMNLEGFERAYRLKNTADDELLTQVFGKDEVDTLMQERPTLIETARSYFPDLTSSTYERLTREPDALLKEQQRCAHEMEQVAVQNYKAFIGSANVTQTVRHGLAEIQDDLEKLASELEPVKNSLNDFQSTAANLSTRRGALRNVLQQHGSILELLELPQLLDACVRYHMYDESLELLAYCGSLLQAHAARGEDIPILSQLQEQVNMQRANLHTSLVAQLRTDVHLPACVRVMGFLRRVQRHSEEELQSLFIEHRGSFLDGHKQQVEQLRNSRSGAVAVLRGAAELLRTHVHDIGTQYKALFPQEDGPLRVWLGEQVLWLVGLLRALLLPPRSADGARRDPQQPWASPLSNSRLALGAGAKLDANSCTTILRQCHIASSTLKRLGAHFFPAIAGLFETRMEQLLCELLDAALLNFHAELGRYDWIPTTALASRNNTGGGSAPVSAESQAAGNAFLHPRALELTRHRPLAVFTNDLIQAFNELRQCTLYGLRVLAVRHFSECLVAALNLLRSVLGSQALQAGSSKAAEFQYMCRHFAQILVPMVKLHLETVFGTNAQLDVTAIIASMAPDLLPASVADDPFAADVAVEEEPLPIDEALVDEVPTASAGVSAGVNAAATNAEPMQPNGLVTEPSCETGAAVKEAEAPLEASA